MHIKPQNPAAIMFAATWTTTSNGRECHFMTRDYKTAAEALQAARVKDARVVRVLYW